MKQTPNNISIFNSPNNINNNKINNIKSSQHN